MRQVEIESAVTLEGCGTGGYVVGFHGMRMSMSFENFPTRFQSCSNISRFFCCFGRWNWFFLCGGFRGCCWIRSYGRWLGLWCS